MAVKKCKNHLRLNECLHERGYRWKCIAIESKLVELFETTDKLQWNEEHMNEVAKLVSPYVFQLEINQLKGIEDAYLEKNRYNKMYRIFNYPAKDCHHVNIGAALGGLCNLQSLKLRFGIEDLGFRYHVRHFDMSYKDIESLAR